MILIRQCVAAAKNENPKNRKYDKEWLLLCLLLHIKSTSAYNFIRINEILPVPSKSTICRYLRASNTGCGFDKKFYALLKKKFETLPCLARHGIISFDEMTVRTDLDVDFKTMKFGGFVDYGTDSPVTNFDPSKKADHALVMMFSSLTFNIHQPIAMFGVRGAATGNALTDLILRAIAEVEKAGGHVHGIVSDGYSTNRKMWSNLGITGKKGQCQYKFENPENDRDIYVFSDVPHLIKCIRNRLHNKRVLKVNIFFCFNSCQRMFV